MKARELYLDFIRGIAILLAMGSHFNNVEPNDWWLKVILIPGQRIGWAGVDLFFVLSGFLIGGLIFEEYKATGGFRAKRFLIRRVFKIWPVLYVYLFLLIVSGRYSWQSFLIQNLLHVQNYFLTPTQHLWSLAVEEHFYIIFAFLLLFLLKRNINIKVFEVILPGTLFFVLALRLVAFLNNVNPYNVYIQTQYRFDALAFGISLAYLKCFYFDFFKRLSEYKVVFIFVVVSGVGLIVSFNEVLLFKMVFRYTITYIVSGALLMFCYDLDVFKKNNPIVKLIAWIGLYSYAMYVYQFVMMRIIYEGLSRFNIKSVPVVADISIKYLGAIFIAYLITKLVEKPSLVLRERLYPSG